jgi:mono/diheme cytochrome c family protein
MRQFIATGLILLSIAALYSCQDEKSVDFARYYSTGSLVYAAHCQNCHGSHGEGLNGLIPPLTDSSFLRKNGLKLPCLLQNGLKGKLIIGNKDFDGEMPATGLAPIEIAQALTYIENSFGNKLGTVNIDTVTLRLKRCK